MRKRLNYRPRRAAKQWLDGDCPKGVLAIFDQETFFDRYTIIYREPVCGSTFGDVVLSYVAASKDPFHPQGFGQHGELTAADVVSFRARYRRSQTRWSALPDGVKTLVRSDLGSEE